MKKKDYLWSLLAMLMMATLSVGLSSCKKDDPDPELTVSKTSLNLQANGDGDKDITVNASHTDWTASVTEGSSWLRVNKNGQLATVSVDANSTTQTRNGKIKIAATADASLGYDISVSQAGADGTLSVNISSVEFEPEGGSQTIQVTSNSGWNVSGNQSWLTVNTTSAQAPTSGSESKIITLTANENNTSADRTCTLTFTTTDGNSSAIVSVTQKKPKPFITVNGAASVNPSPFPGMFGSGKSGVDYKIGVVVNSNIQWTMSGNEDWLYVSTTSGSNTVDMTIYPKTENNSSTPRKAIITLSGSGASANIVIEQEGGKPVCYVLPANEVALYDRMGWEYTATSNVNKFQWILLSEREFNRMTDNELIEELSKEEELKFVDDYLSFVAYDSHDNRITQNSTYYVVTIAYDGDGKAGELKKTKIKTPAFLNVDDDAWVNFANVACNYSQGFWFDAIKEGYCNTYHLIYGIQTDTYNSVVYAFEINYYLKNKKKHWFAENWEMEIVTDYPNNHTFTYSTTLLSYIPICFAYGWGVFKDGTISSDLVGFQWDTSKENARKLNMRSTNAFQNITYRRSVETERAKKMRLMRK